ncbi:MAG: (d)CMP kinase, partial [Pseudomonadota bacterium]|nr:(d)CMP kinase [Pseudomonadota bacterium]
MIIAVDGSAASGKGTLAKRLAGHFNLAHLDTGTLYRALGLHLLRSGASIENTEENTAADAVRTLDLSLAASSDIRTDAVAAIASFVAAMPAVRAAFTDLQRGFAAHPPHGVGAVLDGRDIG